MIFLIGSSTRFFFFWSLKITFAIVFWSKIPIFYKICAPLDKMKKMQNFSFFLKKKSRLQNFKFCAQNKSEIGPTVNICHIILWKIFPDGRSVDKCSTDRDEKYFFSQIFFPNHDFIAQLYFSYNNCNSRIITNYSQNPWYLLPLTFEN